LGRTKKMAAEPRNFYDLEKIENSVVDKINLADKAGESIDFLTFVSDGEPTLDVHLGQEIEMIRSTGKKIGVITNSSLVWRDSVKEDLEKADWVSLKIDSVEEDIWRRINRPHRSFELKKILKGIQEFAKQYKGKLVTETMLVRGLNDNQDQIEKLADFIEQLSNDTSYLSVPIRPPAEKWVQPPTEAALIHSHHILTSKIKNVEYLIGYEGNAFAFTGNVEKDLLSITAVHPMRKEAVIEFLSKAEADWSAVDRLIDKGVLVEKEFQGKKFYARKLFAPRNNDMLGLRME